VRVRTTGAAAGGPAVRRLAAGLLLSRTGDQLTTIALVWFVLDLTESGVAMGLVLLCAGLPPVVTGPLLGRVLDRWPLRRVMVADNLARATLVGAIPTLHWLGRLDMPLVCGLSVAAGALAPATDVGVRVALPRLVDEASLERANVLLSVGDQVSALVGPAVGGLLVGLVGGPPVLLADAASFVAMAALVGPLPDPAGPAARPPAGLATVPVVGRLRPGLALAGNALAWGAALLPLLVISGIVPAMAVLALGGLVWAPYATLEASLLQCVVPTAALGRVFGARRALTAAATPLGAAAGGLLLHRATPTAVIGLSAVTCMLAGVAALCVPALHRLPARRA
jgi:MFS family permease